MTTANGWATVKDGSSTKLYTFWSDGTITVVDLEKSPWAQFGFAGDDLARPSRHVWSTPTPFSGKITGEIVRSDGNVPSYVLELPRHHFYVDELAMIGEMDTTIPGLAWAAVFHDANPFADDDNIKFPVLIIEIAQDNVTEEQHATDMRTLQERINRHLGREVRMLPTFQNNAHGSRYYIIELGE